MANLEARLAAVENLVSKQRLRLEEFSKEHATLEETLATLRSSWAAVSEQMAASSRLQAPPSIRPSSAPSRKPERSHSVGSVSAVTPERPERPFIPIWSTQQLQGPKDAESFTPPKIMKNHIYGYVGQGDTPGSHGHAKDSDFQDGLERGIGHGKRYIGSRDQDRILGLGAVLKDKGTAAAKDLFEGARRVAFADQIMGGVGYEDDKGQGRRYLGCPDHIHGGSSTADEAPPLGRRYIQTPDHLAGDWGGIDEAPHPTMAKRHVVKDHIHGGVGDDSPRLQHRIKCNYPMSGNPESRDLGTDDPPEAHRGRRFIASADHIYGGSPSEEADRRGQDQLGHGKLHFQVKDHFNGFVPDPDAPGSHGHIKDADFEDGLERGMGHGRRHMASALEVLSAEYPSAKACIVASPASADAPAAGRPSRNGFHARHHQWTVW